MEWSPAKQEVFCFESDIVVSAGAGSGKTAALVELYVRLLAGETSLPRPLGVDEIVAITFTDKAAVEMKERVRLALAQRHASGEGTAPWRRLSAALATAPIATFHAFCSRLLRENPIEAGVDPSFSLLDELAAEGELQAALGEVLESELNERTPEMGILLENFPLYGAGRGRGIRDHLLDLRRKRAATGATAADLVRLGEQWNEQAAVVFQERLRELPELAAEAERILAGNPLVFHAKLRPFPELCRGLLLQLESEETPLRLKAMADCIGGSWGKERVVKERMEHCLEQLHLACWQARSAPIANALVILAEKVERAYRLRKERRGGLDFDDLQEKALGLLRDEPLLREEYRRRYPVVMVDEFQDTNPLQKKLVDLLCGNEQRLFIVGDPKQSIYRFRGADVEVFGRARTDVAAKGGKNLYFRESFRSREGIIRFVNRFFQEVMAGVQGGFEVAYTEDELLEPKRRDWDGEPCVELLVREEQGSSGNNRRAEAAAIAARILRLVSGEDVVRAWERTAPRTPVFGDIAVLFRRFTHLKVFERELRKKGIPYYVVRGRGFYQCQEVLDLLNILKYLEYGGDLVALVGVLRSPLCGVSDETLFLLSRLNGGIGAWADVAAGKLAADREASSWQRIDVADREKLEHLAILLGRLRPLRDRLTLAELMEEILTGTDFASSLLTTFQGGQKAANLRKLIELSRSFGATGEGGLRAFINYLAELVETEPTEAEAVIAAEGENVVRLMTIHQSKGLEFPIVFVPELGAGQAVDHGAVQYDDALGIGVKPAPPGESAEPTLATRAIGASLQRKDAAELKRLLYVATTRARDYLILSGEKGKTRGGAWREWIDSFLAGGGSEMVRVTPFPSSCPSGECIDSAVLGGAEEPCPVSVDALEQGLMRGVRYEAPLPDIVTFSPTALEDYASCPRKYYYKAVMGLDEALFAELLGRPSTKARTPLPSRMSPLDKGNLAHLLLEKLDFSAGTAAQRNACNRMAGTAVPDADPEGVAEVIENIIALAGAPFAAEVADKRLMRECPFTLSFAGAARYFVKGAIDLVAVGRESVTVYDYKYLEKKDAELEGYRFQLRVYMLALARRWPEKNIEGKLLFLKGGEVEPVVCDATAFEAELLRIMEAIRIRRGEKEFGLRGGCDGSDCPFRQRCLGI